MKEQHQITNLTENDLVKCYHLMLDEAIKGQLLECATPPISEPITAGKLKWRGISLCYSPHNNTYQLQQKGNKIGKQIQIVANVTGL